VAREVCKVALAEEETLLGESVGTDDGNNMPFIFVVWGVGNSFVLYKLVSKARTQSGQLV